MKIVDEEGKRVVEYRSSSYGEVENIHDNSKIEISAKDHLRYKGYIYDEETRLYYLKTRYYDLEIGRFIQPADVFSLNQSNINGFNLYDYTNNKFINAKHNSSIINLGTIGMSAKSGTTSVFRKFPYVPEWLEILATGLDHGFTMINPIRVQ